MRVSRRGSLKAMRQATVGVIDRPIRFNCPPEITEHYLCTLEHHGQKPGFLVLK
jgi:hypothetical protein